MSDIFFSSMGASEEDLGLFASCFNANGSPRNLERLRWQYADNPTGRIFVELARVAGTAPNKKVAAIYATMPVIMDVEGRPMLGVQSIDTMTDRDFRGRGLFVKMAQQVYERCGSEAAGLVYGFPNKNSAHGFFERLGWRELAPVPFMLRPLRTGYLLRARKSTEKAAFVDLPLPVWPDLPASAATVGPWSRGLLQHFLDGGFPGTSIALRRNPCIRPVSLFDERHDALWDSFRADVKVAVRRDAKYLNWRLVERPLGRHPAPVRQAVYDADGGVRIVNDDRERYTTLEYAERDEVQGLVTYCFKEKHGGRIGYVMELLARHGRSDVGFVLLRRALADMAFADADAVLAWNLPHSANRGCFLANGFVPLPRKLQPIEMHFGVRTFHPDAEAARDIRSWYLSYCDSDTV